MKQSYHGGRALLNKPGFESTGAIVAEVENTRRWKPGKNRRGKDANGYNAEPSVMLQFADCNRSISFAFTLGSAEAHENNLHKVDTMLKLLQQFRAGLAIEQERLMDRLALAGVEPDDDY